MFSQCLFPRLDDMSGIHAAAGGGGDGLGDGASHSSFSETDVVVAPEEVGPPGSVACCDGLYWPGGRLPRNMLTC